MDKVLVVGASGRVGSIVLRNLIKLGMPVKASSRKPESRQWPKEAEVLQADMMKPETMADALHGTTKVFFYANPDAIEGFIKEAIAAEIEHIVLLSSAAAMSGDSNNFNARRHLAVEKAVIKSGIQYTFLRPGAFDSNTLYWSKQIREEGKVRLAYPQSQLAPVHEADIADLAAKALTESGLEGATPWLTGPESISQEEEVKWIGEAIGRQINIEELSPDTAVEAMKEYMPPVSAEVVFNSLKRMNGVTAPVSHEMEKVMGKPARSFADWAKEHAEDFL